MLHKNRVWSISHVGSADELASKLAQFTWTGCSAFQLNQFIFANDSTSSDGAQEYAVLRPSSTLDCLEQIESITFSWCSESRSLELILEIMARHCDLASWCHVSRSQFQTSDEHRVCYLCA